MRSPIIMIFIPLPGNTRVVQLFCGDKGLFDNIRLADHYIPGPCMEQLALNANAVIQYGSLPVFSKNFWVLKNKNSMRSHLRL